METLRASTRAANERELAKADRERGRFHGLHGGNAGGEKVERGEGGKGSNGGGNGRKNQNGNGHQGQAIGLGLVQDTNAGSNANTTELGALGFANSSASVDGDGRPTTAVSVVSVGDESASTGVMGGGWRGYAEGQSSFVRGGPGSAGVVSARNGGARVAMSA